MEATGSVRGPLPVDEWWQTAAIFCEGWSSEFGSPPALWPCPRLRCPFLGACRTVSPGHRLPQCQNLHDSEHLTWLVVNHIQDLISLSHEPPVQDFISAVHRNSAASGLFIQAIQSRCENLSAVSLVVAAVVSHCFLCLYVGYRHSIR